VALDTPIDIPDRNKVLPLPLPPVPSTTQPVTSVVPEAAPVASAAVPPASNGLVAKPKEEPASMDVSKVSPAKPVTDASAAKPGNDKKVPLAQAEPAREATKIAATESAKPTASASTKASDAAKAQALLEDKSAPPTDTGRFVVQVGAFADADRAREVRAKLEKAGLKTYTNVAETKDGPRTRVRVGPFANKPEAKKAAEKIKQLNLPAAVLTL
jgi:DedD protein